MLVLDYYILTKVGKIFEIILLEWQMFHQKKTLVTTSVVKMQNCWSFSIY